MTLIGELVRRSPAATRVWWSRYSDKEPAEDSLLSKLVTSADNARNPITWLGPCSASECLRSLAAALDVPEPVPVQFAITGGAIALPTHFSQALQRWAGSPEKRSEALAAHPRLKAWVAGGGSVLVVQEPGAGGSTLLAAIAEAAGPRGLYYDTRFAARPCHLNLREHLSTLAWQLGVKDDFSQFFLHGAVIAVDGIELRSTAPNPYIDTNFLKTLEALAQAQRLARKGALVIGTHLDAAVLRNLRSIAAWLPADDRTYSLHTAHTGASPSLLPTRDVEPLLNVLGLVATAIPTHVALKAVGLSGPFDWRPLECWVERRGGRVTLREAAHRERRERLGSMVELEGALAAALLKETVDIHPLRRIGLVLEAEALYFNPAGRKLESLSTFLRVADAGLSHPLTRFYFQDTLVDHLGQGIASPGFWTKLPGPMAETVARLAVALWRDRGWPASRDGRLGDILDALRRGRNYVERELIEQPLRWRQAEEASDARAYAEKLSEIVPVLEDAHGRAREAGRFTAARARLALQIGAMHYEVGDKTLEPAAYERGLNWTKCAKQEARRARDPVLAGMASDNEVHGLLKLGRLDEAECALTKRLLELGKRQQGFSHEKAVNFGNLFLFALKKGQIDKAEAHFYEAVLQCVMIQRWGGLRRNLEVLGVFAEKEPMLPKPDLIVATIKALGVAHPIWPF